MTNPALVAPEPTPARPRTPPPRPEFDSSLGRATRATSRIESWHLDVSPGDATRYRLDVMPSIDGGLVVAWPGVQRFFLAGRCRGEHVTVVAGGRGGRGDLYDELAIGCLLDEWVRR